MRRYFNVNLSQNLQTVMPDTEQNEAAVAKELVRIITENKDLKAKPFLQGGTINWRQDKHGKNSWRK